METSLSAAKRILCVVEDNLAAHSLRERDLIAYRAVGPDLKKFNSTEIWPDAALIVVA